MNNNQKYTIIQFLIKIIDSEKHYILEATHPSPLGANRGGWFGSNHFSKSNNILSKIGKEPINWTGQDTPAYLI